LNRVNPDAIVPTDDDDEGMSANDEPLSTGSILNARNFLDDLLKGPLPIPSFDAYVTASTALQNAIDPSVYNELLNSFDYGRQWGNLFTLGAIHITPAGDLADEFVQYLNSSTATFDGSITHHIHKDMAAGVAFIEDNIDERTWALLDLGSTSSVSETLGDVSIRMNYTTLPNTNRVVNFVSLGLSTQYQRYYLSGFLTLQQTIMNFALSRNEDCTIDSIGQNDMFGMPMPTAEYNQNVFYTAVGYLLGLAIAMGFLYPMSKLTKSLVEEKERRLKETMQILGVDTFILWLSHVITALVTFTIIAILVTYVICGSFLPASSNDILFAYIFLFCTSIIAFSFFIASFFSRAKLAAIIGPIALFASLMPRWIFYGSNRYEQENSKVIASLLPCTAFAFGADIISEYEYSEKGVQRDNMW
jgi:ATP-binding cassette subfamily A (ABC1) protein 3